MEETRDVAVAKLQEQSRFGKSIVRSGNEPTWSDESRPRTHIGLGWELQRQC